MRDTRALVAVVLAQWFATGAVCAQAYPAKPVRFIVPTAPGGGVDTLARFVGQSLTEAWGQQVVIDNRGGGSGIIGAELAARAAADGYTFLVVPMTFSVNPALVRKLPYDPINSFSPVTLLSTEPNVLVVHPSLPAHSVQELTALSKRNPNQLNYGYGGIGSSSNLSAALFKLKTGARAMGVSYKSAGPAVTGLLSGETQMMFIGLPPTLVSIASGKLRALAVTSHARSVLLPEVPTMAQSGVADFEVTNWIGMLAPAGTSGRIVEHVNADITRTLAEPASKERMLRFGLTPNPGTSAAFGAFLRAEIERWGEVIRRAGIEIN